MPDDRVRRAEVQGWLKKAAQDLKASELDQRGSDAPLLCARAIRMTQRRPGYWTQSSDTSYEAEQLLIEEYRRMSPADKPQRVAEMCRAVEQLAVAGIRERYPHAYAPEIMLRLGSLRLGRALMIEAFGWDREREGY